MSPGALCLVARNDDGIVLEFAASLESRSINQKQRRVSLECERRARLARITRDNESGFEQALTPGNSFRRLKCSDYIIEKSHREKFKRKKSALSASSRKQRNSRRCGFPGRQTFEGIGDRPTIPRNRRYRN